MTTAPTTTHAGAGKTADQIAGLSAWIDTAPLNLMRDPEAVTWGRLAKIGEECGEVIAAFIGATGQNPRKGATHTMDDVRRELLDVAVTALCAVEHLDGNTGHCLSAFAEHVEHVAARAMRERGPK